MQGYFDAERNVALVIQILDMRHEPTADDFDMINFLIERDLPFLVVCTKSDKLNKRSSTRRTRILRICSVNMKSRSSRIPPRPVSVWRR